MTAAPDHADTGSTRITYRGTATARTAVGMVVGVVLLGVAVWMLRSPTHRDEIARAIDSAQNAPAWLIVIACTLPLANWLFTTLAFWILTRPFGRVALGEMAALMGASWLANYLPIKPGLAGRITYHAAINRIPIKHSARIVLHAVGISAACAAILILLALGYSQRGWLHSTSLLLSALIPICLGACLANHLLRLRRSDRQPASPRPGIRSSIIAAFAVRLADSSIWVVRYLVAFELMGRPIGLVQATALAGISQSVAALPIIGSALGVREWSVGVLSSVLAGGGSESASSAGGIAGGGGGGAGSALTLGLAADLINRVIEIALAIPIGLASAAWLSRHISKKL
ncbi:MAG: hypothetical protein IT435_19820 [Phycisphaerales bacterium]|nr:hypothetical protein [Phycisphaerales bacterium]